MQVKNLVGYIVIRTDDKGQQSYYQRARSKSYSRFVSNIEDADVFLTPGSVRKSLTKKRLERPDVTVARVVINLAGIVTGAAFFEMPG